MPIIEVDHVTKEYRLGALQGLKQTVLNAGARLREEGRGTSLFKALDDVSISIEPGSRRHHRPQRQPRIRPAKMLAPPKRTPCTFKLQGMSYVLVRGGSAITKKFN
jgi:hypothetical protein